MSHLTPTREIVVSPADCRFAARGSRLVARDIGPEVAVAVHIPELEIAALLHCALPHFIDSYCSDRNPWLYADTAIPLLLRRIDAHGISRSDIEVRAIGGATGIRTTANSGLAEETVTAVRDTLQEEGVTLHSSDFGGDSLRSLWFDPRDGRLIVRSRKPAPLIHPIRPDIYGDRIAAFR